MPPEPLVLGFDTSAAHCAAALIRGENLVAARHEEMSRGQAERLFPMIGEMLADAGLSWRDVGLIGVGTGPGNFTGIRLSVAAARGLALSLEIPAIGVNRFQAMTWGQNGAALALVDARRGQFYAGTSDERLEPALYERDKLVETFAGRVGICMGDDAELIAPELGAQVAQPLLPVAQAVARVALEKRGMPVGRPAPLYLKPADAAPSRMAAPVILP